MKCWISAFNAQGSRGIIVVVQVGAVKIYVAAAVEALRKKERQGETQETLKLLRWKTLHQKIDRHICSSSSYYDSDLHSDRPSRVHVLEPHPTV
jgi:hypothetical protein